MNLSSKPSLLSAMVKTKSQNNFNKSIAESITNPQTVHNSPLTLLEVMSHGLSALDAEILTSERYRFTIIDKETDNFTIRGKDVKQTQLLLQMRIQPLNKRVRFAHDPVEHLPTDVLSTTNIRSDISERSTVYRFKGRSKS